MKRVPNIVLYAKSEEETSQRFREALASPLTGSILHVCRDVHELSERLSESPCSGTILLILPENKEDLLGLLPIRSVLFDVRSILVLPDKNSDTVAIGHSLRPRFISYRDGNFLDVAAVLARMIDATTYPIPTPELDRRL